MIDPVCRTCSVETNLNDLAPEDRASVLLSLVEDSGLAVEDLRKARTEGEGPLDPRYPQISLLVRKARADWDRWGKHLVEAVRKLLENGKLLPMRAETEALLWELLRDHEIAIIWHMTGHGVPNRQTFERLIATGLVEGDVQKPSLIEVSWRLGRKLNMLNPHHVWKGKEPNLDEVVREVIRRPITKRDREAMTYCQRKAAVFMRRPAVFATQEAERVLTEAEYAAVRGVEGKAVGGKWGARKFASELAAGLKGHPTLVNDLDRVARTELVFAQCHGAYVALKDQAKEAGDSDPRVFKLVSPFACVDCKRIWGLPAKPRHYRLSEIEEREALGGNFRRPRAQWGPTIGPVHPNCTEGPLQYYDESIIDDVNAIVKDLEDFYDRS